MRKLLVTTKILSGKDMAKTLRKRFHLSDDIIRLILVILGSVFSTIVLTLSVLAIIKLQEKDLSSSSMYLLFIFIVLAFSRLVTFIKERTRISLMRFLFLFVVDIVLGIIIYFGKDEPYLYSLCGGIFCITIIISRIFKIVGNHTPRSIVINGILIILATLLAIGLFIPNDLERIYSPILIVCFIVAISALIEVLSTAATRLNAKTLFKIIIRTFALEIILGLVTVMVASALVVWYYEPEIESFGDGMWFAFETVTTIGYGEFKIVTVIGRIVSVIVGLYGIVVVAVITSIIVNFYNETSGKKETKDLVEDNKQIEKKKKK